MIILRNIELTSEEKIKLFSEIYYEQREYGKQFSFRKIRRNAISKLNNIRAKNIEKAERAENITNTIRQNLKSSKDIDRIINKELEIAEKEGIKYKINSRSLSRPQSNLEEKSIMLTKNTVPGEVSHEVGHIKNDTGKNGLKQKLISNYLNKPSHYPDPDKKGLGQLIKTRTINKAIVSDEVSASKSGLEGLLKEITPRKEDGIDMKRVQSLSNRTYKYQGKANNALTTQNLIAKPEEVDVIERDFERKLNRARKHGRSNNN